MQGIPGGGTILGMGHDRDDTHSHQHPEHPGNHGPSSETSVATFVVHCSDSRREATDQSGRMIREMLDSAGHSVIGHLVVRDDRDAVKAALSEGMDRGAHAVIFTGGTGYLSRDITIETLRPMFDKEIPGFAQLFMQFLHQEQGTSALIYRAIAGLYQHAVVFAIPAHPEVVKLTMQRVLIPELGNLVRELHR